MDKEATCKATNSTVGGINKKIFQIYFFIFRITLSKILNLIERAINKKVLNMLAAFAKFKAYKFCSMGDFDSRV